LSLSGLRDFRVSRGDFSIDRPFFRKRRTCSQNFLVLLEYTYDKSEIYGQDYKDNITFLRVTNKNTFGRG
jgi:hypothetical protein